jgi:hypothetical protein
LILAAVVMLPGCSGCRQDPLVDRSKKELEKEKKKKKPKEDFEFKLARTVPADETIAAPLVKPGHWVTVAHEVKANNFNFNADLRTTSTDRNERPLFIEDTAFTLSSSRPAPLPKGQDKRFETTYFIPRAAADETKSMGLHRELRAATGGRLLKKDWQPVSDMAGYQYFLLVLASEPDSYGYLKRLTSVSSPVSNDYDVESYLYYRVLLPQIERIAPLPSNSLTWTSIAYILWDDADPNILTPDQRRAMLDWLNWGGQVIVSGPNSLERLKGSFLEEHLPATAGRTVELDAAAVSDINEYWAIRNQKTGDKRTLDILPGKPLVGVELQKQPLGEFVPHTGELVAERRIGAGRIVVTAFSLTDRMILRWTSYDSFFNGCLLRRPRRQFGRESLLMDARWADYGESYRKDARPITTLRYFTRDLGHYAARDVPDGWVEPGEEIETQEDNRAFTVNQFEDERPKKPSRQDYDPPGEDWHFVGYPPRGKFGMAAWNDQSGASDAAREALKVAAGISIPKGEFVLKVLAVYLVVLAPVNWGFFRLMGRVEWAWVAAPIMAIIGAVAVVRLAQLDIGFARSVTEIAVVEAQGDYPRAHATRYTAMYTSLADSYDLVFEDESSLAQPFPTRTDFVLNPHDPTYSVSLRRDRELLLRGFQVKSNSTGTVHCEQMADLGGTFSLTGDEATGFQLNNTTSVALQGVGVLRKNATGGVERAWVGELASGSATPLRFKEVEANETRFSEWDDSAATLSFKRQVDLKLKKHDTNDDDVLERAEVASDSEFLAELEPFDLAANGNPNGQPDGLWTRSELLLWSRGSRAGELSVGRLVDLAAEALRLRRGDVRLIGWTTGKIPGMSIRPGAAQEVQQTLFIVHLKRGGLTDPRPDVNAMQDFLEEREGAKAALDEDQESGKKDEQTTEDQEAPKADN